MPNDPMTFLILGLLATNVFFCWYLLRQTAQIIIFLHLWWGLWLSLAVLSLTGLFPPSLKTVALFEIWLAMITVGVGIFVYFRGKTAGVPRFILPGVPPQISTAVEKYFLKGLLIIVAPFIIFFCIRAGFLISLEDSAGTYRAKVFGSGIGYPLLFRYPFLESVNQFVIEPALFSGLFLGVAHRLYLNRSRLLVVSIILMLMHTTMMLGRFGYHQIFMMLVLILVMQINSGKNRGMRKMKGLLTGILTVILLSGIITGMREQRGGSSAIRRLSVSAIEYHTVAFSIFDRDYHDPKSALHMHTYGRSSMGAFERLFVRALRIAGIDKTSQVELEGSMLQEHRKVGRDENGNPKTYNAFGSILYSLYRDGQIWFICLFGVIFGFFIAYYSEAVRFQNSYGTSILIGLAFIGIYGIFQPILGGPIYISLTMIFVAYGLAKRFSAIRNE